MRSNSQATLLELIPERKTSTLDVLREKIRILQTLEREHTHNKANNEDFQVIRPSIKTTRRQESIVHWQQITPQITTQHSPKRADEVAKSHN